MQNAVAPGPRITSGVRFTRSAANNDCNIIIVLAGSNNNNSFNCNYSNISSRYNNSNNFMQKRSRRRTATVSRPVVFWRASKTFVGSAETESGHEISPKMAVLVNKKNYRDNGRTDTTDKSRH